MELYKPLSRSEYKKHLADLAGACAFCKTDEHLVVFDGTHWTWRYAAFPYQKYHTLLLPKRHVLGFQDLTTEEFAELKSLFELAAQRYARSGLVGEQSPFGGQLYVSWRARENHGDKESVRHFHIHLYPKISSDDTITLDPDAHDIDTARLAA